MLVIPGCPGAQAAEELLRRALTDLGLGQHPVIVQEPSTDEAFAGSPTFLVDGTDLFPGTATDVTGACRLYPTPDGLRNVPTLTDLRTALQRAGH